MEGEEEYTDEILTPADVERAMLDLNRRIDKAPFVIKEYHNKVREARKVYKQAFALAFAKAEGTQLERKMAAEIATKNELDALDLAEIEYTFVRDKLEALRTKLRALQSVSSLMKASMFGPQGGV